MNTRDITVYDIAKEAEVSPATVSRVLTGNARVAEEKRKRVEEVIKKYDFHPNAVARSLFKKESKTIGFILPDIINPFFASVFMDAEKAAIKEGYTIILCNTLNQYENEYRYLRTLSERQVDAIILMGGSANEDEIKPEVTKAVNKILAKTPIILINGKLTGINCHRIIVDEGGGIQNLVDYLVSLGHKKIGILGGIKGISSTEIKHQAYYEALKKYDIPVNDEWVITWGFGVENGVQCMEKLLRNKDIPTAIIGINDAVAVGIMKAAKSAGMSIPHDISIAGFDGSYLADITDPELTTVSQNYEEIGQAVIKTILDITNGRDTEKLKVINTKLRIQNSCLNML